MATENAKIRIRNRVVELKLTFEYADHIMDNYIRFNPPHDLNFLDIQRVAKKAAFTHVRSRVWRGEAEFNDKNYKLFIILTSKFAVVKTCYCTDNARKT